MLDKVNISLLKTANNQAQEKAAALLKSVEPVTSNAEGDKGRNVNVSV